MNKLQNRLMGKRVTATHVLKRRYRKPRSDNVVERVPEELPEPRGGWIVGFRHAQNGKVVHNGWDDPAERLTTDTVPCVMVAWQPTMNPVKVPVDGWREPLEDDPDPVSNAYKPTARDIESMKEIAAMQKRDGKGRFTGGLKA